MLKNVLLLLIAAAQAFPISSAAAQQSHSGSDVCLVGAAPDLGAALLQARWRTASELQTMSEDDKRNTTISGLLDASTASVESLQALTDDELIGSLRVYSRLRDMGWQTESQVKVMSLSDQRNTLIVVLHYLSRIAVATLQSLSNRDLVEMIDYFYCSLDQYNDVPW